MQKPGEQFISWAESALARFPLVRPRVRFLGHSENITFHVTDGASGEEFLLRFHRPSTESFVGICQSPAAIESELLWLAALHRDTSITVQQPIRNKDGQLVTLITLPDATILPCTLLRWVAGEPVDPNLIPMIDLMLPLGYLVAALHQHARTWRLPNAFVRPSYDTDFLQHIVELLRLGVAAGIITQRDYAIIQETINISNSIMNTIGQQDQDWGLIHNDLHPGNWILCGNELRPIDFSLCGFGYFLFDLGTCVGSLNVALRQPFLDAYLQREPLPANSVRRLEACFIVSRMSSYAFTLPHPSHQSWLKQRIPQVVATVCARFLRDESFLFELR